MISLTSNFSENERILQESLLEIDRLKLQLQKKSPNFLRKEEKTLSKGEKLSPERIFKFFLENDKINEVFLGFLRPREIVRLKFLDKEFYEIMEKPRIIGKVFEWQFKAQKEEINKLKYKFGNFLL
jgi:hypothetical protein